MTIIGLLVKYVSIVAQINPFKLLLFIGKLYGCHYFVRREPDVVHCQKLIMGSCSREIVFKL